MSLLQTNPSTVWRPRYSCHTLRRPGGRGPLPLSRPGPRPRPTSTPASSERPPGRSRPGTASTRHPATAGRTAPPARCAAPDTVGSANCRVRCAQARRPRSAPGPGRAGGQAAEGASHARDRSGTGTRPTSSRRPTPDAAPRGLAIGTAGIGSDGSRRDSSRGMSCGARVLRPTRSVAVGVRRPSSTPTPAVAAAGAKAPAAPGGHHGRDHSGDEGPVPLHRADRHDRRRTVPPPHCAPASGVRTAPVRCPQPGRQRPADAPDHRERIQRIYLQDGGVRAVGLSDVPINDIDYLDLDY